ncbi:MAG: SDR family NAD(P)-dependent oxidoreductase, partial [Micromonosporaceae bacterium]
MPLAETCCPPYLLTDQGPSMTDAPHAALVTGSTSGIGKAIAMRLLSSGYRVALNYANDQQRAERTLAECRDL